jgi:8-oxo-dGTP diphosphatase
MQKKMYQEARIAIDAVIFTLKDNLLQVLLHKREKTPFLNLFELPGGLLHNKESAEDALKRKLMEMIGTDKILFNQFFTFTNPDRDPRIRTVSIGFMAFVNYDKINNKENLFSCKKLPELAFDHKEIIEKATLHLKTNIDTMIVKQFLPDTFPLNKLQEAYEAIEGKKYDNRNFRKRMIALGIVEETKQLEKEVSHRPAILYRFKAY